MGEYLNQQGYTCLGVRLAGHATVPEDMIASRWTDWTASIEDAYSLLQSLTGHIFFAGLSMGGVLSLLMSTRLKVCGVIAMSTPYKLRDDPRLPYAGLISRFIPFMPKTKEAPGSGWFDKDAWKDHVSYPQNPIRSVGELNTLLGEMRAALPKVNVPVLLIHSRHDTYVLPENMEWIDAALVNASDKTKLYVTRSGHVLTRDAARLDVFRAAVEFIERVESSSK